MTHISHHLLNKKLAEAKNTVQVGCYYQHYKYPDRKYKVILLAVQEATEKVCVIYQDVAHDNAPPFVRDLDSWLEIVEWQGAKIPRFSPLDID